MTRYQFPEGFFGARRHPVRKRKASATSRTVLFGTAGLPNSRNVFISRLGRKPFAIPIISILRTWR